MLSPTLRAMPHKVDGLHGQVVIVESGGVDMITESSMMEQDGIDHI